MTRRQWRPTWNHNAIGAFTAAALALARDSLLFEKRWVFAGLAPDVKHVDNIAHKAKERDAEKNVRKRIRPSNGDASNNHKRHRQKLDALDRLLEC